MVHATVEFVSYQSIHYSFNTPFMLGYHGLHYIEYLNLVESV